MLPLQAEIWRWSPESDEWERVYQSPRDVAVPKEPGKFVARDVGFRDITAYVEPDGTEALYVSGVSSNFIFHHDHPPSLLRSVDGKTFEPVPIDKGTFLGDLRIHKYQISTFRSLIPFRGRLFVIAGGIRGDGHLIVSQTPAEGNNSFRMAAPDSVRVFEMLVYNDSLYVGTCDKANGYSVLRTDANGAPPYRFVPVVTQGGYAAEPSRSVISMQIFQGRLYVGTDRPAEIIRINPDDSWDLVVGTPRATPAGWKYPLSGLDSGFYNWLNGHIWRMCVHNQRLYVGTMKMSTHFRRLAGAREILEPNFGFDLYETEDGCNFAPITRNGFGDMFAFGVRSFADTPHGLFLGSANSWYGLQVWRGVEWSQPNGAPVPAVVASEPALLSEPVSEPATLATLGSNPVGRLEIEHCDGVVTLSWDVPKTAKRVHVWRANIDDVRPFVERHPNLKWPLRVLRMIRALRKDLLLPPLARRLWVPGAFVEVGATEEWFYQDRTAANDRRYLYYVCAGEPYDHRSLPSNLVAAPALFPTVTFATLQTTLQREIMATQPDVSKAPLIEMLRAVNEKTSDAQTALRDGDATNALRLLQVAMQCCHSQKPAQGEPNLQQDLCLLLEKLARRVRLSQAGVIKASQL